jgi:long-chain acyl-CoA synthetase
MIAREQLQRGAAQPNSLVELFEAAAVKYASRTATKQKQNGHWVDTSWSEMARRARDVADGLASLGVAKGERVAIIGETTTDWIVTDLGVMGAAAICVPIYQSNRAHDVAYILENSGARFIFCDSEAQVAKIRVVKDQLPGLEGIIRFGGSPRDGFERTLADVERDGAAWRTSNEGAHAARLASMSLDEPACFIYTSGTTGAPKGVVLTHRSWVYEAEAVASLKIVTTDDLVLCFLPMAHSFAKVIEALWFKVGATAAFVESIDKIVDNAGEVRPTVMPAVPRIFEKAYDAVVAKGSAAPGVKGKLFKLAMQSLDRWIDAQERGNPGLGVKVGLAFGERVVFPKLGAALKERFGGRMRLFVSGGAPLSPRIAWFFQKVGLEILEGYGLTETAAGTFVNRPGHAKIGTVGPPVPGTEVRIAEDGEILIRGPGVMKEYYRNPAATAEVLRDGWLYSGDIGTLDRDGYLKITDRKKDIIVTAGGKNVAPQNLENDLKTDPLISQVMVHGDKRKFLSALVTLNEEAARKWAADAGVALSGPLHEDPRVRARIQQAVDALNAKQASYSTIKKFVILPGDFTQEAGELTPTLKVKRKYCTQKYKALLDAFYTE